MAQIDNVAAIPGQGKNLIVVASVGKVLHFRVFDSDGTIVVNTQDYNVLGKAAQVDALETQLKGLWPPHELTASEKSRLIDSVTSIVGYARDSNEIEAAAGAETHWRCFTRANVSTSPILETWTVRKRCKCEA